MVKQQSKVSLWTSFWVSVFALMGYMALVYGLAIDLTHNLLWVLIGGGLSMLILTLVWRYLHMDSSSDNSNSLTLKLALVLVFILLTFDLWLIWLAKVQLMVL